MMCQVPLALRSHVWMTRIDEGWPAPFLSAQVKRIRYVTVANLSVTCIVSRSRSWDLRVSPLLVWAVIQSVGSLQYNYYQPLANIAIDIGHNLTFKAGWNYYQYGESSFVGPTDPRYFHANNAMFSLRWAF
jgi:hypothetical protein